MRAKCRGLSNLAIEPLAGLCGDARDACIQLNGIRMFDLFARRDDEIVRSLSGSSESGHINTPYLPRVWGVFVTIAQKHKGTYLPYTQCRYRL